MKLGLARVAANDLIMPNTRVITLDSPELGRSATPGQFLHLRTGSTDAGWDPLLRRPMSIFRIRPERLGETPAGVSLLVRDVGRGSHLLAQARPDDRLDYLGPLGHGFELARRPGRLLMVGGGYGAAPLIGLAEAGLPRGAEVTLLVGAASAEYVFPAPLLPPPVEYYAATIDGSLGHPGLVTELVPRFLDWADAVYACGPDGMLRALAELCRSRPRLPVQLAMEQHMGCAMGVCLGCVTPTVHGYKRVCRDGPVFPAAELVWSG
jgi:dihydroorotate dehydrogenase electron transfer subunit